MVKIDKVELFKCFVIIEIIFVLIPMGLFSFIMGFATLIVGFDLQLLKICCVYFFLFIYFSPLRLIASRLFSESSIGMIPEFIVVGIVTIIMYSLVAFLVSLILSLYAPLKKHRKPSLEREKS